jgi:hypothetical protein
VQYVLKAALGQAQCPFVFEKSGVIVTSQNQAVDFKGHLVGIGLFGQVALLYRHANRAVQGGHPGLHRTGQGVAHRARAVVKLHGAADENATGLNFDGDALHPVIK